MFSGFGARDHGCRGPSSWVGSVAHGPAVAETPSSSAGHEDACLRVEFDDVVTAGRDHDGFFPGSTRGPPVRDESAVGLASGAGNDDAAMLVVSGDRLCGSAVAQEVEGFAFPSLLLTAAEDGRPGPGRPTA
jgi:hypothetical protein